MAGNSKDRLSIIVDIEPEDGGSTLVRWSVRFAEQDKAHSAGEAPSREAAFAHVATAFSDMADTRRVRRNR